MFAKLLKHEFRAVKKTLLPLIIAALLASVLGYVIMLFITSEAAYTIDSPAFAILSVILESGIYLFFIIFAIGSSLYLYYRFYKTKFTDEGYLTFTLPATTHQILLASITNIAIWLIILVIILYACIALPLVPLIVQIDDIFDPVHTIWEGPHSYENTNIPFAFILQIIGSYVYSLILPLLSITIGSIIAKKHKILAAFGVGYGISMLVSMVTSFLSIAEIAANDIINGVVNIASTMTFTAILMLAISVGGYFLMHYLVKNKLNI